LTVGDREIEFVRNVEQVRITKVTFPQPL